MFPSPANYTTSDCNPDSASNIKAHERRKFNRINFNGKVDLKFLNYSYECCRIRNLSLTGMCVEGEILRNKGAKNCHVRIYNSDNAENNSLRASARVVWKNGEGIGLAFTTMSFENYLLLQRTLIDGAEDPEPILRELPGDCPYFITS